MNCQVAQDLLLEADRPDLLGESTTELGRHVARCPACDAVARRILGAETALDRALSQPPRRAPARRRMWATPLGALAAAAAVIMMLLPRHPPIGQARNAGEHASAGTLVDVSASAGQTAVVLRTADPGITVVWFFQD